MTKLTPEIAARALERDTDPNASELEIGLRADAMLAKIDPERVVARYKALREARIQDLAKKRENEVIGERRRRVAEVTETERAKIAREIAEQMIANARRGWAETADPVELARRKVRETEIQKEAAELARSRNDANSLAIRRVQNEHPHLFRNPSEIKTEARSRAIEEAARKWPHLFVDLETSAARSFASPSSGAAARSASAETAAPPAARLDLLGVAREIVARAAASDDFDATFWSLMGRDPLTTLSDATRAPAQRDALATGVAAYLLTARDVSAWNGFGETARARMRKFSAMARAKAVR